MLLEILGAATRLGDVDLLGADADLLAELFRLTTIDRERYLADPRFADVPVAELLSDAHLDRLADGGARAPCRRRRRGRCRWCRRRPATRSRSSRPTRPATPS